MSGKKVVVINENTWKELMQLKIEDKKRSIDDVIQDLLKSM